MAYTIAIRIAPCLLWLTYMWTMAVAPTLIPSNTAISLFPPLVLKLTKLPLFASMSITMAVSQSPSKTSAHRGMVPLMVKVGSGMSSLTISPSAQGKGFPSVHPGHLNGMGHGALSMFHPKTKMGFGKICQRMATARLNAFWLGGRHRLEHRLPHQPRREHRRARQRRPEQRRIRQPRHEHQLPHPQRHQCQPSGRYRL